MIVARVIEGGLFTTVQDLGRVGCQRWGVPASGAMDRSACLVANALAGNAPGLAVLEMTLVGPRLEFVSPATIALAGADLGAHLDDEPLGNWQSATVRAGQALWFAGPEDGARGYLAVLGGLDVPVVLGSRSTYARSRLGGIEGRPLAAGDRLHIPGETPQIAAATRRVPPSRQPTYGHEHRVRVVRGPQDDRFTAEGLETFLSSPYVVTAGADRMGYRLEGPVIGHSAGADIVSDGSPLGGVQVAGDGRPIVLMVDRGTAGGYAKIATVVTVDTWRLAQAAPGDTVRFEEVGIAEAHAALRAHHAWLQDLAAAWQPPPATDGARRRKAAAAAAAVARLLAGDQDRRP